MSPRYPSPKDVYGAPKEKVKDLSFDVHLSGAGSAGSLVITFLGATLLLAVISTTLCQQRGFPVFTVKSPASTLTN